jgi:hypothetical protein
MSYIDTFIQVSPDSTADSSTVPEVKKENKTAHRIQYELLTEHPYIFTHEDLIYEVHVRHKAIPSEELETRCHEIREELFQKPHACLRASALPKKYGWGVHYNEEGKIALYGIDSPEYQKFVQGEVKDTKLLFAMRSKRG